MKVGIGEQRDSDKLENFAVSIPMPEIVSIVTFSLNPLGGRDFKDT